MVHSDGVALRKRSLPTCKKGASRRETTGCLCLWDGATGEMLDWGNCDDGVEERSLVTSGETVRQLARLLPSPTATGDSVRDD